MNGAHEAVTGELGVGHAHADAERSADVHARQAEQRLGLGGRPAVEATSESDVETRPAPRIVSSALRGDGEPLSDRDQRRYGAAFDHDFSHVRMHRGADAGVAANSIGARAFAVDHHIAMPEAEPGLLTHELAHVVAHDRGQDGAGVVRRIGVGEWFARLVGEGSYDKTELDDYLAGLEERGTTEGGMEGDDKARQVVSTGRHKKLSPKKMTSLEMRKLLIDEMISGATLDEDEQAILTILRDATMPERQWLVKQVGRDELKDNFHGEEYKQLMALLSDAYDAKDADVPLSWSAGYTLRGDPRVTQGEQAVLLRSLSFRPDGAAQAQTVASDEDLALKPGQTQPLGKAPVNHPRDTGGQGFASLQVGPIDKDGIIAPPTDLHTPTDPINYPKIDPLKSSVLAELDVTVRAAEIGADTDKTEGRDTKKKGHKDVASKTDTHEDFSEDSVEVMDEQSILERRQVDREKRLAKKHEREKAQQKGSTVYEEENEEHQDRKDESEFKEKTEGNEKSGGTETTDGNFDLTGKVDAKLTGELKKAEEGLIKKGLRWVLKIGPSIAPKQYRPILKALGPIGEKILDLFKPGEDDMEIEFDLDGKVTVKGKFHAKTSIEGWKKFSSKTEGSSSSNGETDIKGSKKGSSQSAGRSEADRKSVEEQDAVKKSTGVEKGEKRATTAGKKQGTRDATSATKGTEDYSETGREDMKGKDVNRKVFIAVVEKATLSFKVM